MKVLVHYIDFHWDNHQGGSGKSFELQCFVECPAEITAGGVDEFVAKKVLQRCGAQRTFQQNNLPEITKMQILI